MGTGILLKLVDMYSNVHFDKFIITTLPRAFLKINQRIRITAGLISDFNQ